MGSYLCVFIYMYGTFRAGNIPESLVPHTVPGTQMAHSKHISSEYVYEFPYFLNWGKIYVT